MPDLILHEYAISPFSEKIRLILGFKGLAWKSVTVPSIMPKPDVLALTGGYRKTPFLQIGSHMYCDTALICDVLEHLQAQPPLYPAAHKGLARVLAQWADEKLFAAAMAYNFQPAGVAQVFGNDTSEEGQARLKRFAEDRSAMRQGQPRMAAADAAAAYKSYLRRLSNMLEQQAFLLGDAPCLADFAAYHPLWFTRKVTPAMAGILDATPHVLAWMDRIAAIGHGRHESIDATEAIAISSISTGSGAVFDDQTFQDEHGIALGSQVSIAADTFGLEPTVGELVAATRTHYTLRRVDARAGTVHVHFPRVGFTLKRAPT